MLNTKRSWKHCCWIGYVLRHDELLCNLRKGIVRKTDKMHKIEVYEH